MDRLWFFQIILFSEPPTTILKPHEAESSKTSSQDDSVEDKMQKKLKLRRISVGKRRSSSSSPLKQKHYYHRYYSGKNIDSETKQLQKSYSLRDLELEEVKGFMDLGFIFKKEHLNPTMMRVIPGLQRICNNRESVTKQHVTLATSLDECNMLEKQEEEEEEDEKGGGIMRPYLSEAWLIKKPNSPLLNLKVPREFAASDIMKKHLRFWARIVASEIQQES